MGSDKYNLRYLLTICGVAALGGLLFGYDTAVISGAIGPIQRYFDLSSLQTGWAVSNVAIGCIIGAFASGAIAARLGRKKTLILAALLFTISAVGAALATTFFWFIVYRLIGGIAVGIASAVSPMYMSEVSPKNLRGRALSMQNIAIVFGQVVIFVVNYLIAKGATEAWLTDVGWRVMIGSEIIPCILFCLVVFFIPESPRWLVMVGRDQEALKVLSRIGGEEYGKQVLSDIRESLVVDRVRRLKADRKSQLIRDRRFWFIAFIACMIAFFQQASGVNVMMYFAPVVLGDVTGNTEVAMFMTIWIGVVQLLGNILGMTLMDRVGRVPLFKVGTVGCVVGLLMTSFFLYRSGGLSGDAAVLQGYLTLAGMLVFMLFFAFSWALGAWIIVSEIFPNRMRAFGMSLSVTTLWISNFLIGLGFPILNQNPWLTEQFNGAFPMWLFAALMAMAFLFIRRFLPETNGVALEEMEDNVMAKYPGGAARRRGATREIAGATR
ncbi:MFS transporter [Halomonas sp. 141]|uniref:sugar porter family MFS transporter n=1 Tax=Halomonas sp. 141 TaxID=2056666 RepID=UPI000C2AB741|nr:sugar porter family MFS transporter [Halomonas sp. 141]PJX12990.1 MFS transporter [Halomonas sp. 141]